MTRWNLDIPDETDRLARRYLSARGAQKDDLARFVDEAVRRRVFELTVEKVKNRNAGADQRALSELIDEAVMRTRADSA